MSRRLRASLFVVASLASSCGPRGTGGELVTFHAYASGLAGADGPIEFDTGSGFHVRLAEGRMHVGAVYLRLGRANPGSANASCVGDTTYGLQVPGSVDVDVLSSAPQEFSVLGDATTDLDQSGEIWLVEGSINRVASTTIVASVAGTATRDGATFPFRGSITIGQNRLVPPSNPAQPGENPICKQRIIAPIPLTIRPSVGGNLLLRVDPRPWLAAVDFSTLLPGEDGTFEIPDASTGAGPDVPAGRAFFTAVTGASADVYQFSWLAP